MSKYNFCTLFDSNFLLQGLTMYRSLENKAQNFHLYILALDDSALRVLENLELKHATIIKKEEFETAELKKIKKERTKREYFWTCTPSIILYCLEHFKLEVCTYIDADLFFFEDPSLLLNELQNNSVMIVEHRYDQKNNKALRLGKYCVQFNTFKNDTRGLVALKWWRDRCNEWCSEIPEDGKFGDQKYLDDWLSRFQGVCELQNLGGGVAPWNVSQYDFYRKNGKIFGKVKKTGGEFPLIFYHFHHSKIYKIFGQVKVRSYSSINRNKDLQEFIYKGYAEALAHSAKEVSSKFESSVKFFWGRAKDFLAGLISSEHD